MREASALWKLRTSRSFMRQFTATRSAGLHESERHVPPINSAGTGRQRAAAFNDRSRAPSGELTATETSSTSVEYPGRRHSSLLCLFRPQKPAVATTGVNSGEWGSHPQYITWVR